MLQRFRYSTMVVTEKERTYFWCGSSRILGILWCRAWPPSGEDVEGKKLNEERNERCDPNFLCACVGVSVGEGVCICQVSPFFIQPLWHVWEQHEKEKMKSYAYGHHFTVRSTWDERLLGVIALFPLFRIPAVSSLHEELFLKLLFQECLTKSDSRDEIVGCEIPLRIEDQTTLPLTNIQYSALHK